MACIICNIIKRSYTCLVVTLYNSMKILCVLKQAYKTWKFLRDSLSILNYSNIYSILFFLFLYDAFTFRDCFHFIFLYLKINPYKIIVRFIHFQNFQPQRSVCVWWCFVFPSEFRTKIIGLWVCTCLRTNHAVTCM